jgi:RNA polymerase sigma factor (sigma-70 family)
MNDLHDHELLARCLTGMDDDAWEIFVRKYSRLIWDAIHKTFRSTSFPYDLEDAEDIFSSLFLSLVQDDYKKLRQFRSVNSCALSTWLVVVAANRTIDFMRREKNRTHMHAGSAHELADEFIDWRQGLEAFLIGRQMNDTLRTAVSTLPDQDQRIFDLLFKQGLPAESTSKTLGMSLSALYTRKHRLLEKIKKILSPV